MSSSTTTTGGMNGIMAIRQYLERMVNDAKTLGMKAFLLDGATTQIVSAVYSQTEILNKQVYLVTRLDDDDNNNNDETTTPESSTSAADMSHMKALCFCRPTPANIDHLGRELSRGRFQEYHVFFSCH